MPQPLYFFANWKMYLDVKESVALAKKMKQVQKALPKKAVLGVFPSALAFGAVQAELKKNKIAIGAQNTYHVDKGGYTGEVSAHMYRAAGAAYALVGHAERRHVFHETNHEVREKLESVLAAKLIPVLCIGETLDEKNNNKTEEVIETQLRSALMNLPWPKNVPLIIAYEPVWAIGTGEACDAAVAHKVAKEIAVFAESLTGVRPSVLYGGSVKPETVKPYFESDAIAGVLVGGASAKFDSWLGIVKRATL